MNLEKVNEIKKMVAKDIYAGLGFDDRKKLFNGKYDENKVFEYDWQEFYGGVKNFKGWYKQVLTVWVLVRNGIELATPQQAKVIDKYVSMKNYVSNLKHVVVYS